MLDNLLEIEIAYSMLKSGDDSSIKDPIDVHYEKLKTKLTVSFIIPSNREHPIGRPLSAKVTDKCSEIRTLNERWRPINNIKQSLPNVRSNIRNACFFSREKLLLRFLTN